MKKVIEISNDIAFTVGEIKGYILQIEKRLEEFSAKNSEHHNIFFDFVQKIPNQLIEVEARIESKFVEINTLLNKLAQPSGINTLKTLLVTKTGLVVLLLYGIILMLAMVLNQTDVVKNFTKFLIHTGSKVM